MNNVNSPAPHNFTVSPVKEVYYMIKPGSGDVRAGSIMAPYPGWKVIFNEISKILDEIDENCECLLRYSDVFEIPSGKRARYLVKDTDIFHGGKEGYGQFVLSSGKLVLFHSSISTGCQCSLFNMDLIFEIKSTSVAKVDILDWFDAAHDLIHVMFDETLSEDAINDLKR